MVSSEQSNAGGVCAAPLLILHQGSVTPVMVVRREPPAAGDQGMLQQARRWGCLVPTSGTMHCAHHWGGCCADGAGTQRPPDYHQRPRRHL